MHYTSQYPSPLGELLLAADDAGLTGVWFVGQKYFARSLAPNSVAREIPLFAQVKQWLALYFAGQEPELEIPIHMVGTAFQKAVWRILRTIPYGQTMTYGAIARQVAEELGIRRMSPQAVGGAVGHNPIDNHIYDDSLSYKLIRITEKRVIKKVGEGSGSKTR